MYLAFVFNWPLSGFNSSIPHLLLRQCCTYETKILIYEHNTITQNILSSWPSVWLDTLLRLEAGELASEIPSWHSSSFWGSAFIVCPSGLLSSSDDLSESSVLGSFFFWYSRIELRSLMYLIASLSISFLLSFLSGGCVGTSLRRSANAPLTFCCRQRSRLLVNILRTSFLGMPRCDGGEKSWEPEDWGLLPDSNGVRWRLLESLFLEIHKRSLLIYLFLRHS